MDQHIKAARRQLAGVCVKNLKNNGFAADYFETVPEALAFLQELIPAGALIGFGGSETLKETGILDWLKENGYEAVPVSQLILPGEYGAGFTIDHTGRQIPMT